MNLYDSKYSNAGYKMPKDLDTWEKCYWYLRLLIDTNRYGAMAKDRKRICNISNNLIGSYRLLIENNDSESEKVIILQSVLTQTMLDKVKGDSTKFYAYSELILKLSDFLINSKDYFIFAVTINEFLLPTNTAIENVPTSESIEFAKKYGKAVLDTQAEKGLANLIRDWDSFTESLSLNKERDLIIDLVSSVRKNLVLELSKFSIPINDKDFDIILTALCQEFERRTGQKRKQRAGNDLENVTEFIFNYFGIKTSGKPEHFTASMEVDNWIKDDKGWYIGVSLKRTLRERWKQTFTSDIGLFDRHKIKYIIHVLNNDNDLSDSKVTELGSYRHLFFMPDNSRVLKTLQQHIAMKKYVFPMTDLIKVIKDLLKN